MDEQKKTRLAAALTVNVILLVTVLAAVLIYQLVMIVSVNKKIKNTESEIKKYEKLLDEGEKNLDYLKSEQFLLDYAMKELNFVFPPKN